MAEGIDVSKYQGFVTWKDVKAAGKEFAVARSSIGMRTIDDTFVGNYQRMSNQGLIPGAYHLVVGDATGPEQAANWKRQLDAAGFDKGLLVLDVEGWSATTNGLEAGTLKATEYLCQWVRDNYNRTPIIYTGVYWREDLKQHPDNFGAHLWLSYYGVNDPQLYVPKAWSTWKIWQYSSTGTIPGVNGNCDLDKSAGTLYSLQRLAGWEWDELATEAQVANAVKGVVAAEIDRAIASGGTNKDAVLAALKTVEASLTQTVNKNGANVLAKDDEVLLKLAEVLTTLATHSQDKVAVDLTPVYDAVETLHKHVCQRTDLHM